MNTLPSEAPVVPRRLLMTCDTVGGVWTYALELTRALGAQGIQTALATMGAPLSRAQRQEVRGIPSVEVFESRYKLEWMPEPWGDVAAAGEWLLSLEAALKPDLVHLNGYAHGALEWRAPVVVVGHSCVLSWWRAVHGEAAPTEWNRYRAAVAAGLQAAHLVVAPSSAMLSALVEHYGPLSATRVIPNGRRLPRFKAQAKEPLVLSAGRLWDAAKNVSLLASIAPTLRWPVCVAGEETGPNGGETRLGQVRRLGRLSSKELTGWLARASIYALPARYEPFGLSVLEAALAGCALVLGNIPSLRQVWGEAALFVSPDQPEELRLVLELLMANPERLAEQSAKARRAARRYTAERMALGYLEAYGGVLRTDGGSRQRRPGRPARAGLARATVTRPRPEEVPA